MRATVPVASRAVPLVVKTVAKPVQTVETAKAAKPRLSPRLPPNELFRLDLTIAKLRGQTRSFSFICLFKGKIPLPYLGRGSGFRSGVRRFRGLIHTNRPVPIAGRAGKRRVTMNIEKYSERVRGFLQSAQTHALSEGHQQFTPEHVLKVLLDDDQGMASSLISRAGGDAKAVRIANDAALAKLPKVSGGNGQVYLAQPLAKVFSTAEDAAKKAATASSPSSAFCWHSPSRARLRHPPR